MAAITAHKAFGNVFDNTLTRCANCLVFNWSSDEVALQQCSRCKVTVYCDRQCQEEHWLLVHKEQCKKLVNARRAEERSHPELQRSSVSIYSHHPFPREGLDGDNYEGVILSVGRIISKMRSTSHPACRVLKNAITDLEKGVISAQRRIWYIRKVYPKSFKTFPHDELFVPFNEFLNNYRNYYVRGAKKGHFAKLDLWSSLLLFSEQVVLMAIVETPRFKDLDISKEQKAFLTRMEHLVAACSSSIFPDFSTFLEILCGGSRSQKCTFCNFPITIEALVWSGKGCSRKGYSRQRHPTILHKPNTASIFCCPRPQCYQRLYEQKFDIMEKNYRWDQALEKATAIKCDYCFQLTTTVHRCTVY